MSSGRLFPTLALLGIGLIYIVVLFAAYVLCNPEVVKKYDEIKNASDQYMIYAQLRN